MIKIYGKIVGILFLLIFVHVPFLELLINLQDNDPSTCSAYTIDVFTLKVYLH